MKNNKLKFNHFEVFKTTLEVVYVTSHVGLWIFTLVTLSNHY